MYTIRFHFEQSAAKSIVIENIREGQSLLEVALTHDIWLHHNCGGVCACSTCHLWVNEGDQYLERISKRERVYIDRAPNHNDHSRLGCQCLLLPGSGIIDVTLPRQVLSDGD